MLAKVISPDPQVSMEFSVLSPPSSSLPHITFLAVDSPVANPDIKVRRVIIDGNDRLPILLGLCEAAVHPNRLPSTYPYRVRLAGDGPC